MVMPRRYFIVRPFFSPRIFHNLFIVVTNTHTHTHRSSSLWYDIAWHIWDVAHLKWDIYTIGWMARFAYKGEGIVFEFNLLEHSDEFGFACERQWSFVRGNCGSKPKCEKSPRRLHSGFLYLWVYISLGQACHTPKSQIWISRNVWKCIHFQASNRRHDMSCFDRVAAKTYGWLPNPLESYWWNFFKIGISLVCQKLYTKGYQRHPNFFWLFHFISASGCNSFLYKSLEYRLS